MKLKYPLKNVVVLQGFGLNPDYYAKFGTKGHMGIDFQAPHGTPVYAPHNGMAYYVGPDPHGGDGVYVHFQDEDDPTKFWNAIHWHMISFDDPDLHPAIPKSGIYPVKTGDLLGYADNTGAPYESSGDHLHFGLQQSAQNYVALDIGNGYGGCVDPAPYFERLQTPAEQSLAQASEILTNIASSTEPVSIRQELLNDLKVVIQNIESLL